MTQDLVMPDYQPKTHLPIYNLYSLWNDQGS